MQPERNTNVVNRTTAANFDEKDVLLIVQLVIFCKFYIERPFWGRKISFIYGPADVEWGRSFIWSGIINDSEGTDTGA
jgi:hypothetical protein